MAYTLSSGVEIVFTCPSGDRFHSANPQIPYSGACCVDAAGNVMRYSDGSVMTMPCCEWYLEGRGCIEQGDPGDVDPQDPAVNSAMEALGCPFVCDPPIEVPPPGAGGASDCLPPGWRSCPEPSSFGGDGACITSFVSPTEVKPALVIEVENEKSPPLMIDLVATAWRFLQENIDLVTWIACLLDPSRELADCLSQHILGLDGTVTTVVITGFSGGSKGEYNFQTGELQVPSTDCSVSMGREDTDCGLDAIVFEGTDAPIESTWCYYLCMFTEADQASDEERRCCIIAKAASVLLHELVHLCLDEVYIPGLSNHNLHEFEDGLPADPCSPTFIVENTFLWAVNIRFANSLPQECLDVFSTLFFDDGVGHGSGWAPLLPDAP